MARTLHHGLRAALHRFSRDTRGATAVLFAMLAVPVLGLGLAALDFSRAQGTKSDIQAAADAAAQAGGQMLGLPHNEIEDAVRGYMRTNLPDGSHDLDFVLTFAPDDQALTLKVDTAVPTSILGIVGMTSLDVHVESTVERPTLVIEKSAPHRGVAPEVPEAITKRMREIPPQQLREAEAAARQILQEIERQGGNAEVERLLRSLGQLR